MILYPHGANWKGSATLFGISAVSSSSAAGLWCVVNPSSSEPWACVAAVLFFLGEEYWRDECS
eukprot:3915094-Rhodomonas_salina.3